MAKFKKIISILVVSIMLCSCASSGMLKKLENKVYDGDKGGQLVITKESSKSPKLNFQGPSPITPNTDSEKLEEKREQYKKYSKRIFRCKNRRERWQKIHCSQRF